MTILQDILAAANWNLRVTENFRSVSPAGLYGINPATTTGLTLGYLGGEFNGVTVANGTVSLTASNTNYVVAHRTTGAVTAATNTTNWLNTGTYMQLYQLVASGSTFTIAATSDKRQAFGGAGSGGGSVAGSDKQIQYNASGSFGAEAGFEYDYTTNTLTVPNATTSGLLLTAATATGGAGVRLPHGTAPSSPTNGDVWTTTAGLYARINGSTVGPYGTGGGMSNPLTTTGDIIYSSSGTTAARLGIGSTNQVLTVIAGIPSWQTPSGGSGLTNFTEAVNTSAPNAAIPVVSLTATNAASTVDIALVPKSGGALTAQVADNTTTGGNKRGGGAVDWQMQRAANTQVASGSFSVISGGRETTASAQYSSVGGGYKVTVSGQYSFGAGGDTVTVSGQYAVGLGGFAQTVAGNQNVIVGGSNNATSTGSSSAIIAGDNNATTGSRSFIGGGFRATDRGLAGMNVQANGMFTTQGDAQSSRTVQRRTTTTATPTPLSADGSTPVATTILVLPDDSTYAFHALVAGRSNATGNSACFEVKGTIRRTNAAGTIIVGTVISTALGADAGAAAWAATAIANTTLGGLEIQVTGAASTTIKWVASIWTTEVVG